MDGAYRFVRAQWQGALQGREPIVHSYYAATAETLRGTEIDMATGGPETKRRRGQALAEFALILPVLALILLSTIQLAFIFGAQVGITNAVREAARLASVTTPTTTTSQASSNGAGVYSSLTNGTTGFLRRNVFAYATGGLVVTGSPETQVCYESFTDSLGKPAVRVKVEAYYRHPLFVPLVGAILDGLDGTQGDGLRVGASEEMRVENDEIPTPFSLALTCAT
jgi:Flp pilus assembly protein TadG